MTYRLVTIAEVNTYLENNWVPMLDDHGNPKTEAVGTGYVYVWLVKGK